VTFTACGGNDSECILQEKMDENFKKVFEELEEIKNNNLATQSVLKGYTPAPKIWLGERTSTEIIVSVSDEEENTGTLVFGVSDSPNVEPATWQTSNHFENLTPATTYLVWVRREYEDNKTSAFTLMYVTTNAVQDTVEVVVLELTSTSVTLLATGGGDAGNYMYSHSTTEKIPEVWSYEPKIEDLTPNTQYYFFAMKEGDEVFEDSNVAIISVTTLE
jgi:hypothetical protein